MAFPDKAALWASNFSDLSLLENLPVKWPRGRLVTLDRAAETSEAKKCIASETGGDAIDMETQGIADVCRSKGVRMLALRCISDAVEDNLPIPIDRMLDPRSGHPSPLRIVSYLIARPMVIPKFVRFVRNSKTAQKKLTEALLLILPHFDS